MLRVFLFCAGVYLVSGTALPQQALTALRNAGVPTLNGEIGRVNGEYTNAVNAFKPVNSSCNSVINSKIAECTNCVKSKCEQRAKSVCDVSGWQKVLAKGINIVKSVPDIILKKVPETILKTAPNKIISVAKDVHGFLKDKVVDKVVDTVKNIGSKVGGEVKRVWRRIWGKRRLRGTHAIRSRRNAEPSCNDLQNNSDNACQVYLQPAHCAVCSFNPMTGCTGYKAAVDRIRRADSARSWLDKITNKNFDIVSLNYDGAFTNIRARVQMFGKDFTLSMGTLNPYDVAKAGPLIASKALNTFKQSV